MKSVLYYTSTPWRILQCNITETTIHSQICRTNIAHYIDSESKPTNLCYYSLILRARQRRNKYYFFKSLANDDKKQYIYLLLDHIYHKQMQTKPTTYFMERHNDLWVFLLRALYIVLGGHIIGQALGSVVCFVLDQQALLDFYSSLKQLSVGRNVAPLGHIIPIPSQQVKPDGARTHDLPNPREYTTDAVHLFVLWQQTKAMCLTKTKPLSIMLKAPITKTNILNIMWILLIIMMCLTIDH